MIKNLIFATVLLISTGAYTPLLAQKKKQVKSTPAKTDVKFLDEISVQAEPVQTNNNDLKAGLTKSLFTTPAKTTETTGISVTIEEASSLQFKYALLLDTEVEQVTNISLIKTIDDWMGTRYRLGGSTKDGIDCSALMQTLYATVFGITLPRTAREQYAAAKKISRTEIKEGDLIFFNTIGGISHVGMYLQNNKFIHASSGGGVMISDMYEEYWMKKFIGVGRIDDNQATALNSKP